jgi:hypothetical protein
MCTSVNERPSDPHIMEKLARYLRRVFARFAASTSAPSVRVPHSDLSEKSAAELRTELLTRLIQSETDLAHLFLADARSAYKAGNLERGGTALAKAESIQSDSTRHFEESTANNQSILASLQQLGTALEALQQTRKACIQLSDSADGRASAEE